jgi:hypothetical protein
MHHDRRAARPHPDPVDGVVILSALVFAFFLSAIVQSIVRRDTVTSLLGDDRPHSLGVATGLGMAASS